MLESTMDNPKLTPEAIRQRVEEARRRVAEFDARTLELIHQSGLGHLVRRP